MFGPLFHLRHTLRPFFNLSLSLGLLQAMAPFLTYLIIGEASRAIVGKNYEIKVRVEMRVRIVTFSQEGLLVPGTVSSILWP